MHFLFFFSRFLNDLNGITCQAPEMKMVPGPPAATAAVVTSSSSSSSTHQQFQVTEDTPVDYLEGCMEILVVFPNEKSIPMSIQRRSVIIYIFFFFFFFQIRSGIIYKKKKK